MSAAAGVRLGASAVLAYNTGSYNSPTWAGIPLMDLDQELKPDEVEVSQRPDTVKKYEPTLLDFSISFKVLEVPAGVAFLALRAAFFNKTVLDIQAAAGAIGASGDPYVRCDMKCFQFKKSEPLGGVNTYDVVLKPCFSANATTFGVNA